MPTITIDNVNGSDTQASGCGPATAVYGTGCHGQTGQARLSLDDASSLSTVSVGDIIYVSNAGANRMFSAITAKQDDTASTTGSTTTSDTSITNVASVTGISVGDIIKVGTATPYWTRVTGISGSGPYTLSCSDAAGASESGVTITRYRQVTVEDNWTSPGSTWAIGGKRKDLSNAATQRLFTDLKPGWEVDILQTGTDYDTGGTVLTIPAGDATNGRVVIKSSSGTRPVVYANNTSNSLFSLNASHYVTFRNLTLAHTGATRGPGVRYTTGGSSYTLFDSCMFEGCTYGVYVQIGSCDMAVRGCTFKDNTAAGIQIADNQSSITLTAQANLFYSTQATPTNYLGIRVGSRGCTLRGLGNVFYKLDYGILSATTGAYADDWLLEFNTFHTLLTDGIRSTAAAGYARLMLASNILWGCGGYGINCTNASLTANDAASRLNHNNAFGSCTSGNVAGVSASSGATALTGDPCRAASSTDFRLNKTAGAGAACRAAAWPPWLGGQNNYLDCGALQHADPALPAVADVKSGVQYGDGGTELTGTYSGGAGGVLVHSGMDGGLNA